MIKLLRNTEKRLKEGKENQQAGAFQSTQTQETGAEKLPEKTIFLIYTTAMYEIEKMSDMKELGEISNKGWNMS